MAKKIEDELDAIYSAGAAELAPPPVAAAPAPAPTSPRTETATAASVAAAGVPTAKGNAPTEADIRRRAKELDVDPELAMSFYTQESNRNFNTRDSNKGAVGGFQVMPDTYKGVMGSYAGQRDPWKNMEAGLRYIAYGQKTLNTRDPELLAAGYHAGYDRADLKSGKIPDTTDGAKRTPDYAREVGTRVGLANGRYTKLTPEEAAKLEQGGDTAADNPRYTKLSPEDAVRIQAQQDEADKASAEQAAKGGAAGVMTGAKIPAPVNESRVPVTPEFRAQFNRQWDASTPADRQRLQGAEGLIGALARERAGVQTAAPQGDTAAKFDTTAEGRARRLARDGATSQVAQSWGREGARRGSVPGSELGTMGQSDFDFAAQEAFNKGPLSHPTIRAAVKGYEGYKQGALGLAQATAELVGANDAAETAQRGIKSSLARTTAIGESPDNLQRNFEGAVSSIAQQLPALLGGAATGGAGVPLAAMFTQTFGQEYGQTRAQGIDPGQAATRAAIFGAFEVLGERFGLGNTLQALKLAAKGAPTGDIASTLAKATLKEIPGEQLTTLGQFLTDKVPGVGTNLEAGLAQYLTQVGDTLAQTMMQGGIMMGGTTGVSAGVRHMQGTPSQASQEVDAEAARDAALNKAAAFGGRDPNAPAAPPAAPPAPSGPIQRAIQKGQPEPEPAPMVAAEDPTNMPRVTVTGPDGRSFTGFAESISGDGQTARVIGDDGEIFEFRPEDGVQITPLSNSEPAAQPVDSAAEVSAESGTPAAETAPTSNSPAEGAKDDLYDEAVRIVRLNQRPSISVVQRHLRIGYNRAARLLEQMEADGIVSPMDVKGARELLTKGDGSDTNTPAKQEAQPESAPSPAPVADAEVEAKVQKVLENRRKTNSSGQGGEDADAIREAIKAGESLTPAGKPLADMSEEELRERMRYIAQQAKLNGGSNKMFAAERKKVEAEINKRQDAAKAAPAPAPAPVVEEEPAPERTASGAYVSQSDANDAVRAAARSTGQPHQAVERQEDGRTVFDVKPLEETHEPASDDAGRGDGNGAVTTDGPDSATAPAAEARSDQSAPVREPAGTAGQRSPVSGGGNPTLSRDLAGAKPRYAFGNKQFQPQFANDIDRAAFIASQTTKSKRDADYVKFVQDATGWTEDDVRAHGKKVRDAIKAIAKTAEPGVLDVPAVHGAKSGTVTITPPPAEHVEAAKKADAEHKAKRPQPGEDGYALTDARNDLIDLRTQAEAQGRVADDRLLSRIKRQENLVADMEADAARALQPRSDSQAVNDYIDGKRDTPPTMEEVAAEGSERVQTANTKRPGTVVKRTNGQVQVRMDDSGEVETFTPNAVRPAAEDSEQRIPRPGSYPGASLWWKALTPWGRRAVQKAAGVRENPLHTWDNMTEAMQGKLLHAGSTLAEEGNKAAEKKPVTVKKTEGVTTIVIDPSAVAESGTPDAEAHPLQGELDAATDRYNAAVRARKAAMDADDAAGVKQATADADAARAEMQKVRGKVLLDGKAKIAEAGKARRDEEAQAMRDMPEGTRLRPSEHAESTGIYWEKTGADEWTGRGDWFQNSKTRTSAQMAESGGLVAIANQSPDTTIEGQEGAENDGQATTGDADAGADGQGAEAVRPHEGSGDAETVPEQPTGGDAGSHRDGKAKRNRSSGERAESDLFGEPAESDAGAEQRAEGSGSGRAGAGAGDHRGAVSRVGDNYRIAPGELTRTGSWRDTAERNVEIVELVKRLEAEKRRPTPAEAAQLVKYTGWGASEIANGIFPDKYGRYKTPAWEALGERLKAALTPEEYAQAQRTTQYAHYTSEGVIRSIYDGLARLGFGGGKIAEPGMGVGLFNGLMPASMAANSQYTGIEYDTVTGKIAKLLYPQSNIIIGDFSKTPLPRDFFDAAIGNPPFSATVVSNDPEYKKQRFMLHDYFFAKSIDRVRPGGVLVFVTSKGTMDKGNDAARKYLAERANLLGAIRLPQTAFQANAGTEVVTDVIFLQKKGPGVPDNGVQWAGTKAIDVNGTPVTINEYFAANPQMVLGEHATTGSMYRANEYTVTPREGDLEQHFAEAVQRLPENVYQPGAQAPGASRAVALERDFNPLHKKEGGLYVSPDGTLMQVESGTGVELTTRRGADGKAIMLKPADKKFLASWTVLRDALKQAQLDQLTDGNWEASLAALSAAYDAFVKKHGNLLAFTQIEREAEDGTVSITKRFKNDPLLRLDVEGALAYSLEHIKESGEIVKAPVLSQRVLERRREPEVKTTQDALFVSLNNLGRLDIDEVAKLAGLSRADTIDALGTAIYDAPGEGWQTADEYLSGNVRRKLQEAEAAAKTERAYQRNVDALMAVQPKPLSPSEITVKLGQSWLPPKDIQTFGKEVLGENMRVSYNAALGAWSVDQVGNNQSEYGFNKMRAGDILEAVLNNRQIRLTKPMVEGGKTKSVVDAESTEKANDLAKKMREAFSRWVWTDPARGDRLLAYYNEHFNNIAPRSFDGSHLTLPGVSLRFDLYPHQKRAIWRAIQQGDTYLAHAVGAGKTFTMIASGMEERRLGLSNKPMYVVPNHMLAQFAREFLELYPAANIMVADEQNFHTHNRRRFVAQAALNNPDAIIITHSAFGRIGMSDDYTASFIKNQIGEWEAALATVDKSDRVTIKQVQRRIEALERRLESKQGENKDQVLSFEELGVDRLYVDEGHEFRKLDFATNQSSIKGIDPNGSQRAMDLFMKVTYLRKMKPGRALVMASGTPITNTMGELYTVQRFFQPEQMAEDGLDSFDAWSNQYGDVVAGFEQNAAGGYEVVSRFAKFQNVPELMRRVRSFMDILTSANLGELVQRPDVAGGGREVIVTPEPRGYKAYQSTLEQRIKAIRAKKGPPKKGDDIILKVIADGRFSAIDMRFVDPTMPSDPNSKLNQMLGAVIRSYHDTADFEYSTNGVPDPIKGASHIIFTDIGLGEQSAASRGFDMKAWIEKTLIAGGVKPEHIAFMRDNKQHAKKERLFADMRAGKKRVLIGGKDMETGVNVQKRLVSEEHLDAPWFPSSVEQREGRIVRQGNQNRVVGIRAWATKGSYDSTMWGMNGRKARFIEQAMNGGDSVRSLEDVSEASAFEMAAALASGDERYMRLAGLKADTDRLERLSSAHHDDQRSLRAKKNNAEGSIRHYTEVLGEINAALKKRVPIKAGAFEAKLGKQTFDNRDAFSQAIFEQFTDMIADEPTTTKKIGSIGGFDIVFAGAVLKGSGNYNAYIGVALPGDPNPLISMPLDPDMAVGGIATRAANQVNALDAQAGEVRRAIETAEKTVESVSKRIGAPFPEQAEMLEKMAELQALETELANEKGVTVSADAALATVETEAGTEEPGIVGGAPNEPPPRQSVVGPAPVNGIAAKLLRETLTGGDLGALVQSMLDAGKLVIHETAASLPGGAAQGVQARTMPDGTIHMVASNLDAKRAVPVLLHEMFHSGVRPLLGETQWKNLLVRLKALQSQATQSSGAMRRFWDAAFKRQVSAKAAGDVRGMDAEEFGAYAIEEYEQAPNAVKRWVDDVLGAIKAWLVRTMGIQVGQVTPPQLRALALAALRRAGRDGGNPAESDDAVTAPNDFVRNSVRPEDADAAIDAANKELDREPENDTLVAKDDYIGRVVGDLGIGAKYLVHPRTIAAIHPEFTPVYNTAISQIETRDENIAELGALASEYGALNQDGKANVNKMLELGRLMGKTFDATAIQQGIKNPGYKLGVEMGTDGKPRSVKIPFKALLSNAGDTITLTPEQAAAYLNLRQMFDNALDKFRDQTLEEFGFEQLVGQPDPAKAIDEMAAQEKNPERAERLVNMANFVREIEQSKRTGYVPLARYGDYVVTVKEKIADAEFIEDDANHYLVRGLPASAAPELEAMGATQVTTGPDAGAWRVKKTQRANVERLTEQTVYSAKVETGLKDFFAKRKAGKVDEIPAVKAAIETAQQWVGNDKRRRIVAFEANQKEPGQSVRLQDVDALAEIANIDNDTWDAVRDKLATAIQGRSFRKHFFHSDNVPGYTGDFERAIADYVIGMSGYLSRRAHMKRWANTIDAIQRKAKLHGYAMRYRDYVNSPQEEFAMIRQIGFFSYIAGVAATAFANLTQVPMMTFPTLAQVAPAPLVIKEIARAYKDAAKMMSRRAGLEMFDPNKAPADVRDALKQAWAEGSFVPLETFDLMMTARQRNVGRRKAVKMFNDATKVVSIAFTFAERMNRLVTFIAAARLANKDAVRKNANENLKGDALARQTVLGKHWSQKSFAEWAVDESQYRMGKANRPTAMRGVGAALMQFKGFMIQTFEAWYRMAKLHGKNGKFAAAASLLVLYSLSGVWGMPGADDLREIIEAAYKQITDKDLDLKTELRAWVAKTSGSNTLAQIVNKGASYPLGVDLTRVGMGNIAPNNALAAAGIPFDLMIGRPVRAVQKASANDPLGAAGELSPNFLKHWLVAGGWKLDGVRDKRGQRILAPDQLSGFDIGMKALGFQPSAVTDRRDYEYAARRMETAVNQVKTNAQNDIARLRVQQEVAEDKGDTKAVDKLEAEIDKVYDRIDAHNETAGPEAAIRLDNKAIGNRMAREREGVEATWGKERKQARGKAEEMRGLFGLQNEDDD